MMFDIEDRGRRPLPAASPIEFFSIEIAPMPGGTFGVSVTATIFDDEDLQLINQDIARAQVATIDEAFALARTQVLRHLSNSHTQNVES